MSLKKLAGKGGGTKYVTDASMPVGVPTRAAESADMETGRASTTSLLQLSGSQDWQEALLNATMSPAATRLCTTINEPALNTVNDTSKNVNTSNENITPILCFQDVLRGTSTSSVSEAGFLAPTRANSTHSSLNTPTLEMEKSPFFIQHLAKHESTPSPLVTTDNSKEATRLPLDDHGVCINFSDVATSAEQPGDEVLGDLMLPVCNGSSPSFTFPCEDVDSAWNLGNMAPLALVEGRLNNDDVAVAQDDLESAIEAAGISTFKLEGAASPEAGDMEKADHEQLLNDDELKTILEETNMDEITLGQMYHGSWHLDPSDSMDFGGAAADQEITMDFAASPSQDASLDNKQLRPPSATPSGRRRGRPPVPYGRPITPQVPRVSRKLTMVKPSPEGGVSIYLEESSGTELTDQEAADQKYRRMRDLNNEASKRCRARRKEKFVELESELEAETIKNRRLRQRMADLEAKLAKVKQLLPMVLQPNLLLGNKGGVDAILDMIK